MPYVGFGLNTHLDEDFDFEQVRRHLVSFSEQSACPHFVEIVDKTEFYDVNSVVCVTVNYIDGQAVLNEDNKRFDLFNLWGDGYCCSITSNEWKSLNYIDIFAPDSVVEQVDIADTEKIKVAPYRWGIECIEKSFKEFHSGECLQKSLEREKIGDRPHLFFSSNIIEKRLVWTKYFSKKCFENKCVPYYSYNEVLCLDVSQLSLV